MSENQTVSEEKVLLDKLVDDYSLQTIFNQFIKGRTTSSDDVVSYPDQPWKLGEKDIVIKAKPVPFDEIVKKANGKCKTCNSRGYSMLWIDKKKLADPDNYIILADVPFRSLSEDDQKLQAEKLKQSKLWKIAVPCQCAMKGYLKSQMGEKTSEMVMYTPNFNIVMKISYEFV